MYFGDIDVEQITDVETFKSIFFPQGFDGDTAGLTVLNNYSSYHIMQSTLHIT